MKHQIMRCPRCGTYTLKPRCPRCGAATVQAAPAKFSPDDPYLDYKIRAIREERNSSAHNPKP
ncbi:MAG TPA: RNA-protein complex protein Nop10 [Thermoprotei archaeon]|nr:RNA-protein complex protein Nop10 [TACK group archaeon]HEV51401.1 RNA-protein complex protein Nop10 [Thermoprotei archaeon]